MGLVPAIDSALAPVLGPGVRRPHTHTRTASDTPSLAGSRRPSLPPSPHSLAQAGVPLSQGHQAGLQVNHVVCARQLHQRLKQALGQAQLPCQGAVRHAAGGGAGRRAVALDDVQVSSCCSVVECGKRAACQPGAQAKRQPPSSRCSKQGTP